MADNMEIALRITADLNEARRSLTALNNDLTKLDTAAGSVNKTLNDNASAQNADAAAASANAKAQKEAADALENVSDAAEKAGNAGQDAGEKASNGGWRDAAKEIEQLSGGTGELTEKLTTATTRLGVATVALYAIWKAYSSVTEQQERFNRALAISNNYAATTAGELEVLAQKAGSASGNIQTARDVLEQLAGQGKLTERELVAVSEAATAMAALTGKSADESVSAFSRIADSVTDTAKNINDQYHFLDLATYERIHTLQEQGDTEAAIEVASAAYKDAAEKRLNELGQKLNWLQKLWNSAGSAASSAWKDFSNYLKVSSGLASQEENIAFMQGQRSRRQSLFGDSLEWAFHDDNSELEQMEKAQAAEKEQMRIAAERQRAEEKAIDAQRALEQFDKQNASQTQKRAEAVKELQKNYEALNATETGRKKLAAEGVKFDGEQFSGGTYDDRLKTINEKLKDPKPPTNQVDEYIKSLDRATATAKDSSRAVEVLWERENGRLKTATDAQFQAALALAKEQDAAKERQKSAKASESASKREFNDNERYVASLEKQLDKSTKSAAVIRENEIATRNLTTAQRQQAEAASKALTEQENQAANLKLQIQLWQTNGETAAAAAATIAEKYRDMRAEFERTGNAEGVQKIDLLINMETASAQLDELNKKIQEINANRANSEQLLQAQRDAGLVSEYEAASQVLELHRQAAAGIERIRPALEKLTAAPGAVGQAAGRSLKQIDTQVLQLNNTAGLLESTLKTGVVDGLNTAIQGLADGTMSLGDAVKSLGNAVAQSLLKMASNGLAQSLFGGISGLFGAGGVSAASGAGGWAGIASSLGSLFLADGGHVRGPGTDTSDSIPAMLSNNEFVTRAAVVKQPGALEFLDAFNREGMRALANWARPVRHATGGLAGIPAALSPSPLSGGVSAAEPKAPVVNIENRQQFNLIDDPNRITSALTSPAGVDAVEIILSRNPARYRQIIGGPA
jgi:hypothetical protein